MQQVVTEDIITTELCKSKQEILSTSQGIMVVAYLHGGGYTLLQKIRLMGTLALSINYRRIVVEVRHQTLEHHQEEVDG